jgi:hypothetical protein
MSRHRNKGTLLKQNSQKQLKKGKNFPAPYLIRKLKRIIASQKEKKI